MRYIHTLLFIIEAVISVLMFEYSYKHHYWAYTVLGLLSLRLAGFDLYVALSYMRKQ